MQIDSLRNTPFNIISEAFNRAFADYEMQLDKEQLRNMLKRRGFDPALSFAATDNGRIVSFTFNGTGLFNGIPTAYDTGTGTLSEYRGKGLASQVFEYSIPYLKQAGISQYLLEVLQHNTSAVSVYRKIGFEESREFNYFRQDNEALRIVNGPPAIPCEVKPIALNEFAGMVPHLWDFYPSWQNSFESINRVPKDFIYLGAFTDGKLTGYSVFEPATGDVTQLAVDKQYRRKGIGSLLFRQMLASNTFNSVKIINTDIACESISGFLYSKNIGITGRQFEMIKQL